MRSHIASEIREIENKIIANNKIIADAAEINKIIAEIAKTENRIAELRAQQANINQTTESQKTASQEQPESQEKTESKEQHDKTDSQEKTESKEQHGKTDSHDKIDSGEQHDNHKPEPETSPEYYEPADTSQKKKPGESRASHEPPLPRIRIKICKGGEGGGDGHHRGTITVKSALETKGLTSQEELVLPPFKEERQIRLADDFDSGQEPPSSRGEPAVGLLTMRGLLAEQLFTVHEPFTTNGLDGGQEPPSSKEEQQGGTGRDIDIGDIGSTTETESGAARMPATEEPCAPTLASDSGDYDFSYNFKISDMSTIMKDKGLRPALGG